MQICWTSTPCWAITHCTIGLSQLQSSTKANLHVDSFQQSKIIFNSICNCIQSLWKSLGNYCTTYTVPLYHKNVQEITLITKKLAINHLKYLEFIFFRRVLWGKHFLKKDSLSGCVSHLYRKTSTIKWKKLLDYSLVEDHKLLFSFSSSGIYNVTNIVDVCTKRSRNKINALGKILK